MPVADVAQMTLCNNPSTSAIDNRTANFRSHSPRHAVRSDTLIQTSSNRRTLQLITENNSQDGDQLPNWLREALQVCFVPRRMLDSVTETVQRPTMHFPFRSGKYPPSLHG